MAAEQMKKFTGHLTCPICYELYKKPKYLPCYHSYCEDCLVKLAARSNDVTCPECRKTSAVPTGGVKHFPSNFFINRLLDEVALKRKVEAEEEAAKCDQCVRGGAVLVLCLDCGEFLCGHCFDHHKYSKEYHNHSMMPLGELKSKKESITIKPKAKNALCQKHELELNFYCETCDELVCQYCIMKDHLKHDHDTVKEMAMKQRKELEKMMEPVEKMITELSTACKKVSSKKDKIGMQAKDVEKEIDRYYDDLHYRLQQQRDELKKELGEVTRQKKKEGTLQLEQMESTQAQLESVRELHGAMKNGSDQEAMLMKKQVVDNVKRLSDDYNKLDTQPVLLATMEFVTVEDYKNSIPQFGNLFDDDICPANCEADLPQLVTKGRKVQFKVIIKNQNNHLCHKGGGKVVIQARTSRKDIIPITVQDNNNGNYSASFIADQVGEVKLSVTVKGRQIKGSPFNIQVHAAYTTINQPSKIVNEDGKMGRPWGIAFGRDGMWAVTDDANYCVWIFDGRDQLVRKFGREGIGNGEFDRPLGVAFDDDNHLYVTELKNNRVQKFSIEGVYQLQFGTRGSNDGQINCPLGIAIHNNKVFVAENMGHRISVFHCDGQFSHVFGSNELKHPHYIAVSTSDQLLVADCGHKCIFIYTYDGNFVGMIGSKDNLHEPSGLAVDIYGFTLVAEQTKNRVSIFNNSGILIHRFGSRGSNHGQFSSVSGIALSPTGDIYVCDKSNQRIQIFSLK